jgi:hypothetical protein
MRNLMILMKNTVTWCNKDASFYYRKNGFAMEKKYESRELVSKDSISLNIKLIWLGT